MEFHAAKGKNPGVCFNVTIPLCLLQNSLQSSLHLLQVCVASLLLHEGNYQRLSEMLSPGTENPVCKDTVKPRLTSLYSSHPAPLNAGIALLMLKQSSEVPSNPLQKQSRTKSRAKTVYENQILSFSAQQALVRGTCSPCQ